jgi:hypothetical protein
VTRFAAAAVIWYRPRAPAFSLTAPQWKFGFSAVARRYSALGRLSRPAENADDQISKRGRWFAGLSAARRHSDTRRGAVDIDCR